VTYFTQGVKVIRGFCSGRGSVSVASGVGIKKKIPWEWITWGVGLGLALYMRGVVARMSDSRSWVRIPVTALSVFSEVGDRFFRVKYLGM